MPEGPGTWKEQGVHVLSSLDSLLKAVEGLEERVEAVNTRVWKIALVTAGGGAAAGGLIEYLAGLF